VKRAHRSRTAIWLFSCFALLLVRTSGPYLHLSSDADEPPVSVHFGTNGAQKDSGPEDPYPVDIDVNFVGDALSKIPKIDLDLSVLQPAVTVQYTLRVERSNTPRSVANPPIVTAWWRVRPPLRAPPA